MENLYNVGVQGYNAYLLCDEKNILIDTVPKRYAKELKENIEKHVKLSEIERVVFTRTTPDGAGVVCNILEENPNAVLTATVAGLKNLKEITNRVFCEELAKNNGEISVGKNTLRFIMTPNLSWPDTMMVYIPETGAIFTGNVMCQSPETEYLSEAFLKKALEDIKKLNPEEYFPGYGTESREFAYIGLEKKEKKQKTAAIIYGSNSGNTQILAGIAAETVAEYGYETKALNVCTEETKKVKDYIENADVLFFGTPTVNHKPPTQILSVVTELNVLNIMGKNAFVFGSYGWSGEGVHILSALLKGMKIRTNPRPFICPFTPSEENISEFKKQIISFMEEADKNA